MNGEAGLSCLGVLVLAVMVQDTVSESVIILTHPMMVTGALEMQLNFRNAICMLAQVKASYLSYKAGTVVKRDVAHLKRLRKE